jgi:hypothetical protein
MGGFYVICEMRTPMPLGSCMRRGEVDEGVRSSEPFKRALR